MPEQDVKQPRDRSPNYPYMSLPHALVRAQQFYDQEKRGSAAVPTIAQHWNYSVKSSGLIQSIAAMKAYGLMDEDGRGQDRRLRLSDLALRIILDNRPDSPDRLTLLRQAGLAPGITEKIVEKFPDDIPSDHNLEHFLIFDLSFNPESAKGVVKIFKENALFTKLYDGGNISGLATDIGEPMEVSSTARPGHNPLPASISQAMTGNSEKILGPDGAIVLQFAGEASWEAYDFLENYIKLRKSVLKPGVKNDSKEKKD